MEVEDRTLENQGMPVDSEHNLIVGWTARLVDGSTVTADEARTWDRIAGCPKCGAIPVSACIGLADDDQVKKGKLELGAPWENGTHRERTVADPLVESVSVKISGQDRDAHVVCDPSNGERIRVSMDRCIKTGPGGTGGKILSMPRFEIFSADGTAYRMYLHPVHGFMFSTKTLLL